MKNKDITKLYWHDGVITGLTFNPNYEGESEIILSLELFSDPEETSNRKQYQILCTSIKRFLATCNIFELNDNKGAGNILDGWVTDKVLFIHLFGGLIEIESEKYDIKIR
jgi:hypothetical protein